MRKSGKWGIGVVVLGAALGLLAACNLFTDILPGTPSPLPALTPTAAAGALVAAGLWGGEHVSLDVTASGAYAEFDCAHGTLDTPLTLDASGQFAMAGTYVVEGGMTTQDPPPATSSFERARRLPRVYGCMRWMFSTRLRVCARAGSIRGYTRQRMFAHPARRAASTRRSPAQRR